MKIRGALVVTALGLVALAPQSFAATTAVPGPTLSIVSSAAGHVLPVPLMSGSWTVRKPGLSAELNASGRTITGTETTLTSVFTSAVRHVRAGRMAYDVSFGVSYSPSLVAVPGTPHDTASMTLQVRRPGGAWHTEPGGVGGADFSSGPLEWVGEGVATISSYGGSGTMQFRVLLALHLHNTAPVSFQEQVTIR